MSQEKFLNNIRQYASLATSNSKFVTTGIITGYDPNQYAVIVQTDVSTPDYPAVQTGWIPLASPWVGNQWGMFCPPNLGDVCAIFYQEGDTQVPFATLRFYGNNKTALPVPSGEFWLVHQSGSYIKFTNDGNVSLNGNVDINITSEAININITSDCNITTGGACNIEATGECNVTGSTINIDSSSVNLGDTSGTLLTLVNQTFQSLFNTHIHGGGPPPTILMTPSNFTSNVKAT